MASKPMPGSAWIYIVLILAIAAPAIVLGLTLAPWFFLILLGLIVVPLLYIIRSDRRPAA